MRTSIRNILSAIIIMSVLLCNAMAIEKENIKINSAAEELIVDFLDAYSTSLVELTPLDYSDFFWDTESTTVFALLTDYRIEYDSLWDSRYSNISIDPEFSNISAVDDEIVADVKLSYEANIWHDGKSEKTLGVIDFTFTLKASDDNWKISAITREGDEEWIEDAKTSSAKKTGTTVDEVTYRSYQHTAETHILPYFDENRLKLCDCTVEVLQTYFDEKYRNGRKDGKGGLSSKTMRHHKGILGQALAECVKDGLIPSNPCQYVEMPRRERHEAHFYSAEQLQQLITALNGDPIQPLVKIAALYGLRRSELLGLKWDSIDFENGMVLIRHTVCKMIVTVEKDKTKTQSSRRSFPMTEEAREIFLKAKAEEEENQRLFGKAYQKNDYVFKWPDGRTFAPDYVTHHFSKMLERYGMPHIRFHELRHSCASLLLNNGCGLKDVQEWMGHSDIQTTANIYGHLDTSRKQSLADKLTECLNERC